ncbi:MAG: hypothetical protein NVV82_29575 [Sporocytophaga sp.]|nr:hypothetical protein [Sporocytophaga sp.]
MCFKQGGSGSSKAGKPYDTSLPDQFKPDLTGFDFSYNIKRYYQPGRIVITANKDIRMLKEARRYL